MNALQHAPKLKRNKTDMMVHVACGKKILPDYVNIDLIDRGQEVVGDAFGWLDQQPDGSIEEIRAEHFLEHFDVDQLRGWLSLFNLKLETGGILRCVVPHKDNPRAYVLSHKSFWTEETVSFLGDPDFCKDYSYPLWQVVQNIKNERPDLHFILKKL